MRNAPAAPGGVSRRRSFGICVCSTTTHETDSADGWMDGWTQHQKKIPKLRIINLYIPIYPLK